MSATETESDPIVETVRRRRRWRVPRAFRTPLGMIGVVIIVFWALVMLFAPLIAPYDPLAQNFERLAPPSSENLFGVDTVGRDVFSRVVYAARTTIPVVLLLVAASMVMGSLLGAIAGYFGRAVDEVIMRIADLVLAFPTIILAMVISAALGPGLVNAVIAILLVTWPSYARVSRSLVMTARNNEYVVAGRLLGASALSSLRRDILPNVVSPVLVLAMLDVGTATLTLAGLSFLSLGATPPSPDWGLMISEGVGQFSSWWLSLYPGLAILTLVVAFNLVGDSLRDSLDPRTAEQMKEHA
ncbi:MAG: ABC transporter permease [Propionibacteriaceae bacterium]